jgi:hypothetical protein
LFFGLFHLTKEGFFLTFGLGLKSEVMKSVVPTGLGGLFVAGILFGNKLRFCWLFRYERRGLGLKSEVIKSAVPTGLGGLFVVGILFGNKLWFCWLSTLLM